MRIGVDLLGSDTPANLLLEGCLSAAKKLPPAYTLVCFTKKDDYAELLKSIPEGLTDVLTVCCVEEEITMADSPLLAVRRKKKSSLCTGISMLHKNELDAFVTAGNTGALMAYSSFVLGMLNGVERPALLTVLPTQNRKTAVVDVGANIAPRPNNMVQFARMGAAFQKVVGGIDSPLVGMLNIGVEEIKGTEHIRNAYEELKVFCFSKQNASLQMQFVGNYEPQKVFTGDVDVLVTDGFSGNIFLKTCEGLTHFILTYLKQHFTKTLPVNLQSVLLDLNHMLNYAEYPGAVLCGLDRLVIKCHGYSSPKAMLSGILGAAHLLEKRFIEGLKGYFN